MRRPLAPGQPIAGWRLERRLGEGSHGQVFLARPASARVDEAAVALKLVVLDAGDADARTRFLRQAESVQRLVHPDIVRLLGAGVEGDLGWLAMQLAPGVELTRYTGPARLLPEALVLRVGERIARALAHAHALGFVHRDLKPANVRVHWASDSVMLVDLGLARGADAEATATGVVPGTPAYMAPEQLAGALPDARTDLYALGVTLYQLLSGRLPHEAATMGEWLRRAAQEPAPRLAELRPDLPATLDALLARLLERERARRAADAAAVADALHAIAAAMGAGAP
ncbi:MAG: serine/threonine protein kinase [Proteobacteria bacterium]|nr:serine/threonine protein kinase [Pseudomonadota bacterium]